MDEYPYDAAAHQQELERREQEDLSTNRRMNMDMSKYAGSESKYLKASDLGGKSVKVKIEAVNLLEFDDEERGKTQKPALKLVGKEKQVVCNSTSVADLIQAYGPNSDRWIGKEIRLSTKHYPKFGRDGLVITPIDIPDEPEDEIPFSFEAA